MNFFRAPVTPTNAGERFADILKPLRLIFLTGMLLIQKIAGLSDRATSLIIRFVSTFLLLLALTLQIDIVHQFAQAIPTSYMAIQKSLGLDNTNFRQYAVCPKCHSLYPADDVITGKTTKCKYKKWPDHPQWRKRKPCNTQLHKGNTTTPKLIYCYKSIKSYLANLVKDRTFVDTCNSWRDREIRDGYLADIYDGSMWQDQQSDYLSSPHNFYGLINVDWFQPFKHTPHSVGAIYMTILDLPRGERFQEDNVMLLGILPGPKEPELNINTYLQPMIEELLEFEQGVMLQDYSFMGNNYRFRLFGCSSDLPATRKLGGFLSFHARQGRPHHSHYCVLSGFLSILIGVPLIGSWPS